MYGAAVRMGYVWDSCMDGCVWSSCTDRCVWGSCTDVMCVGQLYGWDVRGTAAVQIICFVDFVERHYVPNEVEV